MLELHWRLQQSHFHAYQPISYRHLYRSVESNEPLMWMVRLWIKSRCDELCWRNIDGWLDNTVLLIFLVSTHVMRRPCWCTKQWQNVAQFLHNNRIKFPKDFFRYCSVHQHGRRDITWKPRIHFIPKWRPINYANKRVIYRPPFWNKVYMRS